jgi:two-component sensor histidine kinase
MSATIPVRESKLIKESQHSMVNGFKVSFANLSLKKSHNVDRPAQFKDRVRDLKSMMDHLYDNGETNESRPL